MLGRFLSATLLAVLGASVIGTIKAYGEYKYYDGRCDSNEFNGVIIEAQHKMIKDLCEKLKEKEEES